MSSISPIKSSVDPAVAAARSVRPSPSPTPSGTSGAPAPASSQAARERTAAPSSGVRVAEPTPVTAAAAAATAPEPASSAEQVTRAGLQKQMDSLLAATQTSLQFRVDDEVDRLVVSVVDQDSGEVLLQIPGEVALRIAKSLAANGQGLVNEKA